MYGFIFATIKDFSRISIQYVTADYQYTELALVDMNHAGLYPWFTSNDSVIYYNHNYRSTTLMVNETDSVENDKFWSNLPQQAVVVFAYENNMASVNTLHASSFVLYPNPSTGRIFWTLPIGSSAEQMTVYDAMGKEVHSQTLSISDTSVDLSHLPKGVYFIRLDGMVGKVILD